MSDIDNSKLLDEIEYLRQMNENLRRENRYGPKISRVIERKADGNSYVRQIVDTAIDDSGVIIFIE